MSNVPFCWVNICPCSTNKSVLLSSCLHLFIYSESLLLAVRYRHISVPCLHFLHIFISPPSVFSFSLFFLSLSQGTGALCTIVMATTMGRQDGGVRAGLASFYRRWSCVYECQMLSLKFHWKITCFRRWGAKVTMCFFFFSFFSPHIFIHAKNLDWFLHVTLTEHISLHCTWCLMKASEEWDV